MAASVRDISSRFLVYWRVKLDDEKYLFFLGWGWGGMLCVWGISFHSDSQKQGVSRFLMKFAISIKSSFTEKHQASLKNVRNSHFMLFAQHSLSTDTHNTPQDFFIAAWFFTMILTRTRMNDYCYHQREQFIHFCFYSDRDSLIQDTTRFCSMNLHWLFPDEAAFVHRTMTLMKNRGFLLSREFFTR